MLETMVICGASLVLHNTEGMKQTQLVNMAPFTTSSSGRTTKKRRVSPMMCIVSKTRTTKKSEKEDRLHDLKTQILADLKAVPAMIMRIVMRENDPLSCLPLSYLVQG